MTKERFYQEYANTPLEERFKLLDVGVFGLQSLHDVYFDVKRLDEYMAPIKIRQDELLRKITDHWIKIDRIK